MTENDLIIAALLVAIVVLFVACAWLANKCGSTKAALQRRTNDEDYIKHLAQALQEVQRALESTGENRLQAHKAARDHLRKMEDHARAPDRPLADGINRQQYIPEVIKRLTDYCITIKDPTPG